MELTWDFHVLCSINFMFSQGEAAEEVVPAEGSQCYCLLGSLSFNVSCQTTVSAQRCPVKGSVSPA